MDDSRQEAKGGLDRAPADGPQAVTCTTSTTRSEHTSMDTLQILHEIQGEAVLGTPSTQVSSGPLWAHTRAPLASPPPSSTSSTSPTDLAHTLLSIPSTNLPALNPSVTSSNAETATLPIDRLGPMPQLQFQPLSWSHLPDSQTQQPPRRQDLPLQALNLPMEGAMLGFPSSEGGAGSSAIGSIPSSLLQTPSLASLLLPQSLDPSNHSSSIYHPPYLPNFNPLGGLPTIPSLFPNPALHMTPNPSDSTSRLTSPPKTGSIDHNLTRNGADALRLGIPTFPLPTPGIPLSALLNPYALALYYQNPLNILSHSQLPLTSALPSGASIPVSAGALPSSNALLPSSPPSALSKGLKKSPSDSTIPTSPSSHHLEPTMSYQKTSSESSHTPHSARHSAISQDLKTTSGKYRASGSNSAKAVANTTYFSPNHATSTPASSKSEYLSSTSSSSRMASFQSKSAEYTPGESFVYRNKGSTVSFSELLAASTQGSSLKISGEYDTRTATIHTSSHATRISSLADEGLSWDASLCDTTGHLPSTALTNPSPEDWFHSWQLNRRVAAKWLSGANAEVLQLLFDISKFYACNFEGHFLEFIAPEKPSESILNEFLHLIEDHISNNMESDTRLVHVATSYFNCSSRKRAAPECAAKLNTQLWFDAVQLEFFESIEGAKKSNSKNLHSAACRACHKSRLPPSVSTLRVVDRLLSLGHTPAVVEDMIRAQALAKTGGVADDGRLLATTGTIFNRQRKVRTEQSKQAASPHPSRRKTTPQSSTEPSPRNGFPRPPSVDFAEETSVRSAKHIGRASTRATSSRNSSNRHTPIPSIPTDQILSSLRQDDGYESLNPKSEEEEALLTLRGLSRSSPPKSPMVPILDIKSPSSSHSTAQSSAQSSPTSHSARSDASYLPPSTYPSSEPNPKKRLKDAESTEGVKITSSKRVRHV